MTPEAEANTGGNLRTMQAARNKTILVADSDPVSRELLRELLQSRGYAVIEASTGQQAYDDVMDLHPDLVVMELYLPELHGLTVARRLRTEPQFAGLKMIAVSTVPYDDCAAQALSAGFDRYIAKPAPLRHLLAVVEQALR